MATTGKEGRLTMTIDFNAENTTIEAVLHLYPHDRNDEGKILASARVPETLVGSVAPDLLRNLLASL